MARPYLLSGQNKQGICTQFNIYTLIHTIRLTLDSSMLKFTSQSSEIPRVCTCIPCLHGRSSYKNYQLCICNVGIPCLQAVPSGAYTADSLQEAVPVPSPEPPEWSPPQGSQCLHGHF